MSVICCRVSTPASTPEISHPHDPAAGKSQSITDLMKPLFIWSLHSLVYKIMSFVMACSHTYIYVHNCSIHLVSHYSASFSLLPALPSLPTSPTHIDSFLLRVSVCVCLCVCHVFILHVFICICPMTVSTVILQLDTIWNHLKITCFLQVSRE